MLLYKIENLFCSYDKHYREGISHIVLEVEHLELSKGRKIFIVGESGIGKSTILETLGMMNNTIVPNEKTKLLFYESDGKETDICQLWKTKNDKVLSNFRRKNYSFIFQSTNLMRNFTAYENVAFTRMLQGFNRKSCFEKTQKTLNDLGLDHVDENRMAQELSGGQQQRLSFARAILPDFTVLFGDEPTGNLDSENANRVMSILSSKLDELDGASAIIVSHDMHLAVTFADVIIKIRKESRPRKHESDEEIYYGKIDDKCIFTPLDDDRSSWGNGLDKYQSSDFENYLRKE